jgi:uncharacterized membrane protein
MKGIRIICNIQIIFYILFISMNLLESIWYGTGTYFADKNGLFSTLMRNEVKFHDSLNILSIIALFLFLVLCNQFIKKHDLAKGYHFLILLISFLPIVNYFLLFIIWRKSTKILFKYFKKDVKMSDLKIVWLWILQLLPLPIFALATIIIYYSNSPSLVTNVIHLRDSEPLIHSIYLLIISCIWLFYLLEFKRAMNPIAENEELIEYSQLLDD